MRSVNSVEETPYVCINKDNYDYLLEKVNYSRKWPKEEENGTFKIEGKKKKCTTYQKKKIYSFFLSINLVVLLIVLSFCHIAKPHAKTFLPYLI